MVASNRLQNLYLNVQKYPGDPFKRILTLHNRGLKTAHINLGINPTDQRSQLLQQWGSFDKTEEELTLKPYGSVDPKKSKRLDQLKVILTFKVPPQAEPGFYSYEIQMRSSHYPGEDIRRSQQIEVAPSAQEALLRTEPKLKLSPSTSSEAPSELTPGATLSFQLTVENLSQRTDLFVLACADLSPSWMTIKYPERADNLPGIVTYADGLQLNPQEAGTIGIDLHPPQYAPAGHYFPTFQLKSRNRPGLVLLKILYFTLEADATLSVNVTPNTLPIPNLGQHFKVTFTNEGNVQRQLVCKGWDTERLLSYQLEPAKLTLAPGEQHTAQLTVQPRQWWQRLWRLQERTVDFKLLIENALALQPATGQPKEALLEPWVPTLPEVDPHGTVLLKVRRRWLFHLLVFLASTGLLLLGAWIVWEFVFWRPHNRPKIANFTTTKEAYQEEQDSEIRLNFDVVNSHEFESIKISRTALDSQLSREIDVDQLIKSKQCSHESMGNSTSILNTLLNMYRKRVTDLSEQKFLRCRDLSLTAFSMNSAITNLGNQAEPAFSKRKLFSAVRPVTSSQGVVNFSTAQAFQYLNGFNLDRVKLAAEKAAAEAALEAGAYTFTLEILSKSEDNAQERISSEKPTGNAITKNDPVDIAFLENVIVSPPALPQVKAISVGALEYRIKSESGSEQPAPLIPITLSWELSSWDDIAELRLSSLSPEGTSNMEPVTYVFQDDVDSKDPKARLPEKTLRDYCQPEATDNRLICTNVPVPPTQVGNYMFSLTVVPKGEDPSEPIVKSTPPVAIKPPLPEITDFQLNGESVQAKPQHVFVINPALGVLEVALSWEVKNHSAVEILPAPGRVEGKQLLYTVSAAPGAEMLVLRVVNELGEEVTQSVVIEKIEFSPGTQAPFTNGGQLPPGVSPDKLPGQQPVPSVPVPSVTVPDIAPLRIPPQAN